MSTHCLCLFFRLRLHSVFLFRHLAMHLLLSYPVSWICKNKFGPVPVPVPFFLLKMGTYCEQFLVLARNVLNFNEIIQRVAQLIRQTSDTEMRQYRYLIILWL